MHGTCPLLPMRTLALLRNNGGVLCDQDGHESHLKHSTFQNFEIFSPVNFPCWGDVFRSENFQKSQPESGIRPELFFQKSSIFSNISYRGVSWSDCLPRGVYIGMYKDLYYKMMTFKNRVWMENDFRGPIFLIFHFQISPPIWDM